MRLRQHLPIEALTAKAVNAWVRGELVPWSVTTAPATPVSTDAQLNLNDCAVATVGSCVGETQTDGDACEATCAAGDSGCQDSCVAYAITMDGYHQCLGLCNSTESCYEQCGAGATCFAACSLTHAQCLGGNV